MTWRIEDPYGFELEIQSQNLMMLINTADIIGGVIQGKCIWGRRGADNILLHENSEEYKNSFTGAESLKKSKINKKNLVIGNAYINTSGTKLIYLGEYYIMNTKHNNVTCEWGPAEENKKVLVYEYADNPGEYVSFSSSTVITDLGFNKVVDINLIKQTVIIYNSGYGFGLSDMPIPNNAELKLIPISQEIKNIILDEINKLPEIYAQTYGWWYRYAFFSLRLPQLSVDVNGRKFFLSQDCAKGGALSRPPIHPELVKVNSNKFKSDMDEKNGLHMPRFLNKQDLINFVNSSNFYQFGIV